MKNQPCFFKIFISRIFKFILCILFFCTNCNICILFLFKIIGATCLNFLQIKFGIFFELLCANAIIIIIIFRIVYKWGTLIQCSHIGVFVLFDPAVFLCSAVQCIHCASPLICGTIFCPYILIRRTSAVAKFFHDIQLFII